MRSDDHPDYIDGYFVPISAHGQSKASPQTLYAFKYPNFLYQKFGRNNGVAKFVKAIMCYRSVRRRKGLEKCILCIMVKQPSWR